VAGQIAPESTSFRREASKGSWPRSARNLGEQPSVAENIEQPPGPFNIDLVEGDPNLDVLTQTGAREICRAEIADSPTDELAVKQ
jgi:hypothetical protein